MVALAGMRGWPDTSARHSKRSWACAP